MARSMFALALSVIVSTASLASSADFDIRLRNDSNRERAAAAQLRRLLDKHEVSDYIFTYSVMIDEYDAPHSHPVLTINAVYLEDDNSALSIFLHEQLHWLGMVLAPNVEAALVDLRKLYPTVPGRGGGGARDDYSTYVHLIVGLQEFRIMSSLVGTEEAARVLAGKTWYTWIYQQVLENEKALAAILEKHQLDLPLGTNPT